MYNGPAKKRERREKDQDKIIKLIKEECHEQLLPALRNKMEECSDKIVKMIEKKGSEKVSNIQIMGILARKSNYDVMSGTNTTYSPQEITEGFNLYLDMIEKINEIKTFPPTVESFCCFMGISSVTYRNWLVEPYKMEIMEYINSYLLGVLATGGLTGELKEISSMYQQKCLGKVEQNAPMVVEHKKVIDMSEIEKQLNSLKRENIIDAEIEEI